MRGFLLLAVLPFSLVAANPPLLLQQPTLSSTHIAFVYAGEIWTVPRDGGQAQRLTAGAGNKSHPVFSPDGETIAFTGEYDGNLDVYTIPSAGGVPKRLTWHPAPDVAIGWTRDGKNVLFTSAREEPQGLQQLFTIGVDAAFPRKLPLPWGWEGSYSPDGSRLAYVPMRRAFTVWKHYRGGDTAPIWLASLSDSKIEKIPRDNSNDINPLWVGEKVYFLSDRNGPFGLFSYDTRTRQVKEEVHNNGLDFKSAGAGPGGIVIEQFGSLLFFDTKTGRTRPVSVTLAGDLGQVRDQMMNVGRHLANAHLSPNAARAVFEANGEIITVPAEKGDVRDITNTPGVMERSPAWSPDGKTIAYLSDESGEYALHLAPQNGEGAVTKIPAPEPGFYRELRWSPDSSKIAMLDSHMRIWCVDLASKTFIRVDQDRFWNPAGDDYAPVWSPDSKWLAYSKRIDNYMGAIFVYSLADAKAVRITDGLSDAKFPAFDKSGKYLFFAASTNSGPTLEPDVGSFTRPVTRSIYLAVLSKSEPSPLAPESDEEKTTAPKPSDEKPAARPAVEKTPEVKIDFDNISQRILAVPVPARQYIDLQAGKAGVIFITETPEFAEGPPALTVHRYDLKSRKEDNAAAGVQFFEVSLSGEKMLTRQQQNWAIRSLPPAPPADGAAPPRPPGANAGGQLHTQDIEVKVSPMAEWKQMYREAWHVERDFFYDSAYHGLDLAAAEKRYRPFVDGIGSRSDLNYLFSEMLGNLVVSHLSVGGGQQPDVKRVPVGLLGCDFSIENNRYRFARVFNGENWNPEARAPLTQPFVNVVAGEYLLAVRGRGVAASDNVYSFFEETAGKQITIRVGPDPSGANSREVTVVPVQNDARLRMLAWVEGNRRKVDQMTGGRVAYVYLPDTSVGGETNFTRYFFAQVDKQAVVVDERFNHGGSLATDFVEFLSRKMMSSIATRDGAEEIEPQGAIFGPKVMLINEFAGSGGDALPFYFRRAAAGELIGMRTWGGLVGRAYAPALMDGGVVTAPSSRVWDPVERQWIAENTGIAPDIEIENDPALVRQGRDPQLERAVQEILAKLQKNPPKKLERPPANKYNTLR